jgi:hypothetical protein
MQNLCRFERAGMLFQLRGLVASQQRYSSTENIPAGHHNSDLSSVACNIGLGRRRDICLRHDITVYYNGQPSRLSDIFKACATCNMIWQSSSNRP